MGDKYVQAYSVMESAQKNHMDAMKTYVRLCKEYNYPHETTEQSMHLQNARDVVRNALNDYNVAVRKLVEAEGT